MSKETVPTLGVNALEAEDAVSPEVEAFKAWGRTHHKTAEERADRLHERAAKAKAEAQGRMAAFDRIANNIPVGQPILLGHHSEKRHRRDIERMRTNLQKGFEASDKAKSLEGRAQAVEENRSGPRSRSRGSARAGRCGDAAPPAG